MISPHTKPGTKIICIDSDAKEKYKSHEFYSCPDMNGLAQDRVYTVREIVRSSEARSGFEVILQEITRHIYGRGYDLARFRYLELPRCLTELLETAASRAPSELEPVQ